MDLKILMLLEEASDAVLIGKQLFKEKLKFMTERVDKKQEFIKALHTFSPDIIISNHALSKFNSMAALEVSKKLTPNIPFIFFVTEDVTEDFAVSCIKLGADDYILKSNLQRLGSSIKKSIKSKKQGKENIAIKKLNKEIENKNEKLTYQDKEKDRFVGMVSHDLQSHISSMMLTLSLMKKSAENITEHKSEYVKRLDSTTKTMYKLLSDFLTVNRIKRGIIEPLYSLVSLGNQVEEMVAGYQYIAARKNIKLNYTNSCRHIFFRTDMSYTGIIADNLISNAIKYSPRGGSIDIKVSKTGGKHRFSVKDQGEGIPAADIPKMYGHFQKLSPKPTAGEPSHGLGLSIVKDLVDALKSNIECISTAGKGTTFTVTF